MTRIFATIIIAACLIGCAKKMVKQETRTETTAPTVDQTPATDIVITTPPHPVADPAETVAPVAFPGASLFFGFNVDTLKTGQKRVTLARIATWLNLNPAARITVSGYADTAGSASYNQKLSARRAARVRAWLLAAGIDGDRVLFEGRGELRGPPAKCRKATVTLN